LRPRNPLGELTALPQTLYLVSGRKEIGKTGKVKGWGCEGNKRERRGRGGTE